MTDQIGNWKKLPLQDGYSNGNTQVTIEEDGIEVLEDVNGYSGYTSRTFIPYAMVRELLSHVGLAVVATPSRSRKTAG